MGRSTPLVTILQHEAAAPPALLGRFLSDAGLRLDVRRLDRADEVPAGLSGCDALIVLGGDMNVGEEADTPSCWPSGSSCAKPYGPASPPSASASARSSSPRAAGGGVVRRA